MLSYIVLINIKTEKTKMKQIRCKTCGSTLLKVFSYDKFPEDYTLECMDCGQYTRLNVKVKE